jgi:hypothetical protein
MKPSRFKLWYRIDDIDTLGYNTLATSLTSPSEAEHTCFQEFCDKPSGDFFERRRAEELGKGLAKAGFIVSDQVDERSSIAETNASARQSKHQLSLTNIPTLTCSFHCCYCLSYTRPGRMNAEV